MAIPTKEVFEDFFDCAKWEISQNIADEISILESPSPELIENYLKILDDLYAKHTDAINQHEIVKWFSNQENFKRTDKSLFKRRKTISNTFQNVAEADAYRLSSIVESFSNQDSYVPTSDSKYYELHLKNKARNNIHIFSFWFGHSKRVKLWIEVIRSFYNYFYSERATNLYKAKNDASETLEYLRIYLNKFFELKEYREFLTPNNGRGNLHIFGNNNNRFVEDVNKLKFSFPIERNDKTIKERVLIYDLNKLFYKHFKVHKANAIFYLLMLEGVENNIEKRNIERMIAKWKTDD